MYVFKALFKAFSPCHILSRLFYEETTPCAKNEQGIRGCNSEFIARSRLRIDTRKWLAAKLIPRLYGDKDDASVSLKFPSDVKDANSLLPMSTEVFRALGNQEITPKQAKALIGTLKDYSSSMVLIELNERMNKLLGGEKTNRSNNEREENAQKN